MSVELSENIQKHLELIGSLQKPLGKTENDSETREVELVPTTSLRRPNLEDVLTT